MFNQSKTEPPVFVQFEADQCTVAFLNDVVDRTFSFHGEPFQLREDIQWLINPSQDLEWLITLHKFYYAPGLADLWLKTDERRYLDCLLNLILTWIEQTPVNFIAPDVTARRLQNWAYAWCLITASDRQRDVPPAFYERFTASITAQVQQLREELAPSRNHRTLELYAILVVSLVFADFPRAVQWRRFALSALIDNIRTDLQVDGVHCEQSTHYHHIVLRSYLLTYRLALRHGWTLPSDIEGQLCRALDFALHVRRPDGEIPALSDSDNGAYGELLSLGSDLFERGDLAYAASFAAQGTPPRKNNVLFDASGYAVMRSSWQDATVLHQARHLIFDVGPVGCGNHGHLDALSVDISAYGRALIVDPGRFTYDEGGSYNWRNHFRGTVSHNTVTVDNRNQGILRRKREGANHKTVAPFPRTRVVTEQLNAEPAYICGAVASPNYAPVHYRHIWFARQRYWVIYDLLVNPQASVHDYRLRYQLTPQARGNSTLQPSEDAVLITAPGLVLWVGATHNLRSQLESAWVAPKYGEKFDAPRVCVSQRATSRGVFIDRRTLSR